MVMLRKFVLSLVTVWCVALSGPSMATPERSFALVSLIGDKLDVVLAMPGTGSNIDRNRREVITDPRGVMDTVALRLALAAVQKAVPGASAVALGMAPSALHERQERLFDGDSVALPGALVDALVNAKASHLLLITKRRAEARVPFQEGHKGVGQVQGLGFYVDFQQGVIRGDNLDLVRGYIAPFAYLRLSLVDVISGKVLAHEAVEGMRTVPATQNANQQSAWDAMTPAQKVTALERLLREALDESVAKLLSR